MKRATSVSKLTLKNKSFFSGQQGRKKKTGTIKNGDLEVDQKKDDTQSTGEFAKDLNASSEDSIDETNVAKVPLIPETNRPGKAR